MSAKEFLSNWLLNEFWQVGAIILSMFLGLGIIRRGSFLIRFVLGTVMMWVVTNGIAFVLLCYILTPS